ncbi:hypothetical protein VTL71DRAFT_3758 [Oculimacula yallundae]|uniref:Uncharacterized protein n=1 Tax=Oculimacula yallundae TaxID=86028 RepID=A0ABR4C5L4_9HELO
MSTIPPGSTSASATLDGSDDPWALAKARFLSDLDPSERELFNNATLENLYYATSNSNRDDAEKSRTRGVATKLGPLVSAIESYGKALDTFAQIAPLYLAPIWGSIRVVLILARSYGKFFERVVDTLGRIGDILPRFRDYERIYSREKHQRLTQALSNAYLDIIVLCTQFRKTLREQKASSFRRLLKPMSLDRQFDEAVERFRQHKKAIDEEARICHMIEAAEKRDKELIHFAIERKQRLLSRLSTVGYEYKHQKLKAVRHSETGTWLTKDSLFQQWQSSTPSSSVLCCYGIPGCGKSILSSSIVDFLAASNNVIYYYCDYADKRTLDPANLFGTLARQVLKSIELVPEPLAIAIEEASHDGNRLTDHSCALDLLLKCIATCTAPIYISIDGLDEMTEESQKITCKCLRQAINDDELPIMLFLTGREDLQPLLQLKSSVPFSRISITASLISSDIRSYVQASTRRRIVEGSLVLGDQSLEAVIVDELVRSAQGMFLWVEFQLCDLCDAETDHAIKLVLQNLPKSLSETYDRLLGKIEGLDRREMILRMFKWIVCARRPLHVDELREGVAFTLDDEEWTQEKVLTNFNRLVRACGNLVVIDEAGHIVTLAHFTVQQYLLKDRPGFFHFSVEDANEMAGQFCLAYLNFSNFETSMTTYKHNAIADLVALEKLAANGPLMTLNSSGHHKAVRAWRAVRGVDKVSPEINMTKYGPKTKPKMQQSLDKFTCLDYVIAYWLSHTSHFTSRSIPENAAHQRRDRLFNNLISWKILPFDYRHWQPIDDNILRFSEDFIAICLLGWALVENHTYLLEMFLQSNESYSVVGLLQQAWSESLLHSDHSLFYGKLPRIIVGMKEEKYPLPSTLGASNQSIYYWYLSRLLWACQKGNFEVLSRCGSLDAKCKDPLHALVIATVRCEATGVIQYLLETKYTQEDNHMSLSEDALLLLLSDRSMWQSALEQAVMSGQVQSTCYLRDNGFEVNELFPDAESYLCFLADAIAKDNLPVLECVLAVRTILSYDIDALDQYIAISQALLQVDGAGLELLVEYGMQPDVQTIITSVIWDPRDLALILSISPLPFAFSPANLQGQFFSALWQESQMAVQRCLELGIDPNMPHSTGRIAIVDAIRSGNLELVSILCVYGCSLQCTPFGLPLSIAAAMGNLQIAEILVRYGAELFGRPTEDQKDTVLAELFGEGSENKQPDPTNHLLYLSPTPLYMACRYGREIIVEMLLLRGSSEEFPSPTRHFVYHPGDMSKVLSHLTIGPDGNLFEPLIDLELGEELVSEWKYPVATAIEHRHHEIVEMLHLRSSEPVFDESMSDLLGLMDVVRLNYQSQFEIQVVAFQHRIRSGRFTSTSRPASASSSMIESVLSLIGRPPPAPTIVSGTRRWGKHKSDVGRY